VPVKVRIAGHETLGSIGYIAELPELAAKNGVVGRVEYLGTTISRKGLLGIASKAHVGLSLMPKQSEDFNMQRGGVPRLSSRALRLPVTLMTRIPIESALRWYLEHPGERQQMGRKCKDKIRQAWNYETMFATL
jgi:hypothetical protein